MKNILILSSLLLAISCSYKNQTLDLKISPEAELTQASKGSNIFVTVFDDRKNHKIIGHKTYYKKTIEISSSKPLQDLLEDSINKKLKEHGFTLNQNRRYLDIRILEMDYNSKKGIFIGSSSGKIKAKAIIKNYNQTQIFEKTFDLSIGRKHAIISHLATDKKTIENLLSETISDILQDESIQKELIK